MPRTKQGIKDRLFQSFSSGLEVPLLESDFFLEIELNADPNNPINGLNEQHFVDHSIMSITVPALGYSFSSSEDIPGKLAPSLHANPTLSFTRWEQTPYDKLHKPNGFFKELPVLYRRMYEAQFTPEGTLRVGYNQYTFRINFSNDFQTKDSITLYHCAITLPRISSLNAGSKSLLTMSYEVSFDDYSHEYAS